jgi:hypothetical protein
MDDAQPVSDRVLALLDGAFDALARGDVPLSEVVARAARIALLRNDFDNVLWLEMEQRSLDTKEGWEEVFEELAGHYGAGELKKLQAEAAQKYMVERQTEVPDGPDGKGEKLTTFAGSVRDIEANMASVAEMTQMPDIPDALGAMGAQSALRERQ